MWRDDAYVISNSDSKRINRWKRAIKSGSEQDWDWYFLQSVINDAKAKETRESYTKYYQCAKFIRDYYIGEEFKYTKEPIAIYTCCRAYPDICGGSCCSGSADCQCDMISDKWKKTDNCWDDCCAIYKSYHPRKFTIKWV